MDDYSRALCYPKRIAHELKSYQFSVYFRKMHTNTTSAIMAIQATNVNFIEGTI